VLEKVPEELTPNDTYPAGYLSNYLVLFSLSVDSSNWSNFEIVVCCIKALSFLP